MIGLPMDMYPAFLQGRKTVLLTAQAASDPNLTAKIDRQLRSGGDVFITTGLLKAVPEKIAPICELRCDDLKAIVNDFGNLYDYPAGALNEIRRTMSKDLDLYLEGPSKVGLFLYDNKTVIVENFNDGPVDIKLVGKPGLTKFTDLETGETVNAVEENTPNFRRQAPAAKAAMTIKPHSYRAFRYE